MKIELIDHMGDEARIAFAARLTRNAQPTRPDANLVRALYRAGHLSVFEHVTFQFLIDCPRMVTRQWCRHRIASPTELSFRHNTEIEFYFPPWGDETLRADQEKSLASYHRMLANGHPPERARAVLNDTVMTRLMWTANLRSILNFLDQRLHPAAQEEIRWCAGEVRDLVADVCPTVIACWQVQQARRRSEDS